jgi:transcriptional regulator of arginine metabolism
MKQQRHHAVRELLVETTVSNQDELRSKLADRGFKVTQATLSRDIRELRLLKGPSGYALPQDERSEESSLPDIHDVLKSFGIRARLALNLLVVMTATGSAQTVAAGIDYEDWPEVVGTIAGDDTVLIICPDEVRAQQLKARIDEWLA